jgi:hypothetical protein
MLRSSQLSYRPLMQLKLSNDMAGHVVHERRGWSSPTYALTRFGALQPAALRLLLVSSGTASRSPQGEGWQGHGESNSGYQDENLAS